MEMTKKTSKDYKNIKKIMNLLVSLLDKNNTTI